VGAWGFRGENPTTSRSWAKRMSFGSRPCREHKGKVGRSQWIDQGKFYILCLGKAATPGEFPALVQRYKIKWP